MKRVMLAGLALVIGATLAAAQDPIAARKEAMKGMGQSFYGVATRMIRGEDPYDQAKVDAIWVALATNADKAKTLWPDTSKPTGPSGTFNSSPKIWDNKADFDARTAKLIKEIADTRGKVTNLDTLKTTHAALNQNCSGCHEQYRVRN